MSEPKPLRDLTDDEHYSVLSPEVLLAHDGRRLAERNQRLIDQLLAADALIVAGQAQTEQQRLPCSIIDLGAKGGRPWCQRRSS